MPLYPARRLCALSGISYRQADYWTTNGLLHPTAVLSNGMPSPKSRYQSAYPLTAHNPGTGFTRQYAAREVSVAYVMRYLTADAHLPVFRAALVARAYVEDGTTDHVLCDHVTIHLDLDIPEWPDA